MNEQHWLTKAISDDINEFSSRTMIKEIRLRKDLVGQLKNEVKTLLDDEFPLMFVGIPIKLVDNISEPYILVTNTNSG